jgi:hypothetical protein
MIEAVGSEPQTTWSKRNPLESRNTISESRVDCIILAVELVSCQPLFNPVYQVLTLAAWRDAWFDLLVKRLVVCLWYVRYSLLRHREMLHWLDLLVRLASVCLWYWMLEGWVVLVVLDDQVKGIKLLFHVVLGLLGFPWKRDFPLLTSVRSNNPVRTNPLPHTHTIGRFSLLLLSERQSYRMSK